MHYCAGNGSCHETMPPNVLLSSYSCTRSPFSGMQCLDIHPTVMLFALPASGTCWPAAVECQQAPEHLSASPAAASKRLLSMNATPDQTGTNSSTTHLQVLQISNSCDMLFLHSKPHQWYCPAHALTRKRLWHAAADSQCKPTWRYFSTALTPAPPKGASKTSFTSAVTAQ